MGLVPSGTLDRSMMGRMCATSPVGCDAWHTLFPLRPRTRLPGSRGAIHFARILHAEKAMADNQEAGGWLHPLKLASLLACAVLIAGCGSGAVRSPDKEDQPSSITQSAGRGSQGGGGGQGGGGSKGGGGQGGGSRGGGRRGGGSRGGGSKGGGSGGSQSGGGQGGGGGGQGGEKTKYSWVLPAGDTSPSGGEGPGYLVLMQCPRPDVDPEASIAENWATFSNPRNVLLFMAAAHLCHGDTPGGRPFYDRAVSKEYGLDGLRDDAGVCDVYRSVVSVLLQKPRDSVICPGGRPPQWKEVTDSEGRHRDNPLTVDVDESQRPTSSPSGTSTSNSEKGTTSAGDGAG